MTLCQADSSEKGGETGWRDARKTGVRQAEAWGAAGGNGLHLAVRVRASTQRIRIRAMLGGGLRPPDIGPRISAYLQLQVTGIVPG